MSRPAYAAVLLASLSMACATSPRATPEPAMTPATQAPPPMAQTSQASSRPAALNLVGTYDYTATLPDGMVQGGNFTIAGTPGAYTGTIYREGMAEGSPFTNVAIDGQTVTLNSRIQEGDIVFTINFVGSEFTGKWAVQGAEGAFNGKRR